MSWLRVLVDVLPSGLFLLALLCAPVLSSRLSRND